ncbi:MAG: Hsp20/alpha crystallin family protein [Thiobacillaceae bacterium]
MNHVLVKHSLLAFALATVAGSVCAKDCTSAPGPQTNLQGSATAPVMGTVVYFNPVPDLIGMQAAMDREFSALNAMWVPVLMAPPANFAIPMQTSTLHRTANGYELRVNLPGFRPEDIHVQLNGRFLSITAHESTEGTYKVGNSPGQRMSTSNFSETLTLPASVEASGMKQSVENGVLTITLPSSEKVGAGKA